MISFLVGVFLSAAELALKLWQAWRKTPAEKVENADHAMLEAAANRPDDAAVDERLRRGEF